MVSQKPSQVSSRKHRFNNKEFAADLKHVYRAVSEEAALEALDTRESKWGQQYPLAIQSWRNKWHLLSTCFAYPEAIRKAIYTTNAVKQSIGNFAN